MPATIIEAVFLLGGVRKFSRMSAISGGAVCGSIGHAESLAWRGPTKKLPPELPPDGVEQGGIRRYVSLW